MNDFFTFNLLIFAPFYDWTCERHQLVSELLQDLAGFQVLPGGKKKEKGDSLSAPGWQQSSTGSQRQLPLIYPATPPVSGVGGEVPGASENPSRITTIARSGQRIAVKRRLRR